MRPLFFVRDASGAIIFEEMNQCAPGNEIEGLMKIIIIMTAYIIFKENIRHEKNDNFLLSDCIRINACCCPAKGGFTKIAQACGAF